mmetsp:Transcript_7309/g.17829  ORF Transcript_7309/g.17829 Transcript_7309/m.17829 type:complete len:126 (+) Transcript_7309:282-659(+)
MMVFLTFSKKTSKTVLTLNGRRQAFNKKRKIPVLCRSSAPTSLIRVRFFDDLSTNVSKRLRPCSPNIFLTDTRSENELVGMVYWKGRAIDQSCMTFCGYEGDRQMHALVFFVLPVAIVITNCWRN